MKSTPESQKENVKGLNAQGKRQANSGAHNPAPRPEPRINAQNRIFPKLEVGAANDPAEREADLAAEQVMRGGKVTTGDGGTPNDQPGALRMKANSTAGGGIAAPTSVESKINSKRGKGGALPKPLQQKLSHTFGTDFSSVKVHTDSTSHGMNAELGAKAFTQGSDMFFGKGQYAPGTPEGDRLIAHEAAHVVQGGMGVKRKETESVQAQTPALVAETDPARDFCDSYSASISEIMLENYEIRFEKYPEAMLANADRWLLYMNLPEDEKPKTFKEIFFTALRDKTGEIIKSGITGAVGKIVPFGDKVAEFTIDVLTTYLSNPMNGTGNAQKTAVHAELIAAYENLFFYGSAQKANFITAKNDFVQNLSHSLSQPNKLKVLEAVQSENTMLNAWMTEETTSANAMRSISETFLQKARRLAPDKRYGHKTFAVVIFASSKKTGWFGYKATRGSRDIIWEPGTDKKGIQDSMARKGYSMIEHSSLPSFMDSMNSDEYCRVATMIRAKNIVSGPPLARLFAPKADEILKVLGVNDESVNFNRLSINRRAQLTTGDYTIEYDESGDMVNDMGLWNIPAEYNGFLLKVLRHEEGFPTVKLSSILPYGEEFDYTRSF